MGSCSSETFNRLLVTTLRSSPLFPLAEAPSLDDIVSLILWIVGSEMGSTLLEKSNDFISTVIDDDDDVIAMLIQLLIQRLTKVGLLTTVIEKSPDENKLERLGSLDLILHFMEKLSFIHSCSEVMSSSDLMDKVVARLVKSPAKCEVASHCAPVVFIIANVLADGKHLVPLLSHDLPFLDGLFDILRLVSDDDQARYAIQCKSTFMKNDLESHMIDEEDKLSAEDSEATDISTSLRAISLIMERWIVEESPQGKEDAPVTANSIDMLGIC